MEINKKNLISEGLVHKIYRYKDSIYKVPKDEFEDFNNFEHFAIERNSHKMLRENSLPAVEVIHIYEKGKLIRNKYVLEEPYIKGNIIDNPDTSYKHKCQIITSMLKVNEIIVNGFGKISSTGNGGYSSWRGYLLNTIEEANVSIKDIAQEGLEVCLDSLINNINTIPELDSGKFLLLDTNSNNFIFDDDEHLIAMLDIDHPISGDKLYEYAALKWYHPESYNILVEEFVELTKRDKHLLNYYFLHFGSTILSFEIQHHLDITNTLRKFRNAEL